MTPNFQEFCELNPSPDPKAIWQRKIIPAIKYQLGDT